MITVLPTRTEDLEEIIAWENDAENQRFIFPYSMERHIAVIQQEHEFHFKVFDPKGKALGFLILALTEKEHESMEFRRIVVLEKGRGYGRKFIQWVKKFTFEEKNCHRLWLDVFTDNPRAHHLYQSEGFKEEGIKRECILTDGKRRSLVLMSIIASEYNHQTSTL